MKILSYTSLILSLSLLTGCSWHQGGPSTLLKTNVAAIQYGVVLQPAGNELKVRSKPKGWGKGGKKDGYIGFDEGQSGLIIFGLKKEDIDDSCSTPGGDGTAKWVISEILLSATGDTSTEKGTNFGKDQSAYPWLAEAFPGIDLSDGSVFRTNTKTPGKTSVAIFSANQQKSETLAYYQVTVMKCSTGETVKTDPAIGNRGRR